jgi:hypothetical protein
LRDGQRRQRQAARHLRGQQREQEHAVRHCRAKVRGLGEGGVAVDGIVIAGERGKAVEIRLGEHALGRRLHGCNLEMR